MTLSVGLGRIINDPKATILTRKALGALSNPALLVTDKGLTIDNSGRLVLRLASDAGLSEDSNGLAVKLAPNGGITVDSNGLSVAVGSEFDVLTCNSLIVNTVATVGTLNAGDVESSGNVSGVNAIFSGGAAVTGVLSAGSASITGALTAGSFSPSSLSVSGALTAGSAVVSGAIIASSVTAGSVNSATGTILALSSTTGTISFFNATSATVSGLVSAGSVRVSGGTTMGRLLSFLHTVTVPVTIGPHKFVVSCPGAVNQDAVVVTLVAEDFFSGRINSWSGSCFGNDIAEICVMCDGGGSTTVTFRVVIMGF